MKKVFEFILVLIIFYGVYSVFHQVAPLLFDAPKLWAVVVVSLIVSALLLFLYGYVATLSTKKKLRRRIRDLEGNLEEKEKELKEAVKFKQAIETEAEESVLKEDVTG
ncbi:hypothetical protein KC901_00020 [Patescibacteria group bacterium]|nr:hypothetical protein [Patescibacteria group bacterium]